jgi:hypothetical protein
MSQDQSADARQEYEYVYHWDRIIGVGVAISILIGVLFWMFPGGDEMSQTAATPSVTETEAGDGKRVVPLQKPVDGTGSTAVGATAASSNPEATAAQTGTASTGSLPGSDSSVVADGSAASLPDTSAANKPVADPSQANASNTASAGVTASDDLRQGEVRVLSRSVSNAAINQVIDQELVAIPKGLIDVGKHKAVRLVFSAKLPTPGEPVNFSWFHEGRQVVTVKTRVSPEGTITGSKYVSFDTPGDWQVKLSDAKGNLLAEAAVRARRR